jgi:hypothetical protein
MVVEEVRKSLFLDLLTFSKTGKKKWGRESSNSIFIEQTMR